MIICFAGPIGSGKTSTAKAVASILGWRSISFGNYVRSVALEKGFDVNSRQVLQDLGEYLISEGWDEFCRGFLNFHLYRAGESVVIDGIRHAEAITTLKRITKQKVFLIYLDVEPSIRKQRLSQRGISDSTAAESHQNEIQVESTLKTFSDLIVKAEKSLDLVAEEVITFVHHSS